MYMYGKSFWYVLGCLTNEELFHKAPTLSNFFLVAFDDTAQQEILEGSRFVDDHLTAKIKPQNKLDCTCTVHVHNGRECEHLQKLNSQNGKD